MQENPQFFDTTLHITCNNHVLEFKSTKNFLAQLDYFKDLFELESPKLEIKKRKNKHGLLIEEFYHAYYITFPGDEENFLGIMDYFSKKTIDLSNSISLLQGMSFFGANENDVAKFCYLVSLAILKEHHTEDCDSMRTFLYGLLHIEFHFQLLKNVLYRYFYLFTQNQKEELRKLSWIKQLHDFDYFQKNAIDDKNDRIYIYYGQWKQKWGLTFEYKNYLGQCIFTTKYTFSPNAKYKPKLHFYVYALEDPFNCFNISTYLTENLIHINKFDDDDLSKYICQATGNPVKYFIEILKKQ